ncbi:tryptophanyl-tRNA synthetase [Peribacillus deserti]|uniref:Tryptophan--tRNA ligase n=1 Tax=Peribacillus deserti TaxID=673318 RepID=A0ABS2QP04_9BACI|nr:tryptophan--tRNA ligase [Peribacillus deserti]MBM7694208.1 tryptophanyl-tRNA synthetase [Peribacillus deserti]
MKKPVVLTGIKSTGTPHLGNYIGAIKPALQMADAVNNQGIYFIADYHALNSVQDPFRFRTYTYEIAATWLALGLDPDKVIFYKQSDVPELLELHWILSCVAPKGLMNRAHAYKAAVERNKAEGLEKDHGVNMGLYSYPILMAADILLFQSDKIPVGKDQIQHVEYARDLAEYFNRTFGETFKLPEYVIQKETELLPGLDGRKMSKSYGNTISLFEEPSALKKLINKIKTDSTAPSEPKDPKNSTLFQLYKEFASIEEVHLLCERYRNGIGWGEVKQEVFVVIDRELTAARQKYKELLENRDLIDHILEDGALKARALARVHLAKIKKSIGL